MTDPLKILRRELDATGLAWEVRPGKRHRKLYIGDRFVSILPLARANEGDQHSLLNTRAQIRRAAKEARA